MREKDRERERKREKEINILDKIYLSYIWYNILYKLIFIKISYRLKLPKLVFIHWIWRQIQRGLRL